MPSRKGPLSKDDLEFIVSFLIVPSCKLKFARIGVYLGVPPWNPSRIGPLNVGGRAIAASRKPCLYSSNGKLNLKWDGPFCGSATISLEDYFFSGVFPIRGSNFSAAVARLFC